MNESREITGSSVRATSRLIDVAKSTVQAALDSPPTYITSVVEGGRDAIVISWMKETSSGPVEIAMTMWKPTADGLLSADFYEAHGLIGNSGRI